MAQRGGPAGKYLFVHQNFPGQFRYLAPTLAALGHEVVGLGEKANVETQRALAPGVRLTAYRSPDAKTGAPALLDTIAAPLQRAHLAARAAQALRQRGFSPQVVYAHIGWGEGVFLKDVFPEAKLLLYCEFFYDGDDKADTGFDAEFLPARSTPQSRGIGARQMNAPLLMAAQAADAGIAPTEWQRSRFPAEYREKIRVIHDGIDTVTAQPRAGAEFTVPGTATTLRAGEPVVTYVSRNLEPYRGFHVFMRALPEILARNPGAQVVVVGGDRVSYSPRLPRGQTYRQLALQEIAGRYDPARLHFVGWLPRDAYLSLLQVSAAHAYLTYPFVLSWSLLEAMSAGCVVVASRTAPVEEVVRDGENGLLVDFFSPGELAERVSAVLREPRRFIHVRQAARRTILERFDLRTLCLPQQVSALEGLLQR